MFAHRWGALIVFGALVWPVVAGATSATIPPDATITGNIQSTCGGT